MSEHRPSAEECLADIAAAGWAGHVAEIRMAMAEADHDYRQLEKDKDAEIARLREQLRLANIDNANTTASLNDLREEGS